jgi:MFS family permease
MSSWISGFMENALQIDKTVGDVLGVAMFAILLGIARILYARIGKNISRILLLGMIGAAICYLTVGLSLSVPVAFVACILTGFCTAMLWPGTLILMEEKVPGVGVAAYALMAASGDFGASLAPQLLGIVVDSVSGTAFAAELGTRLNLSTEQIGMKAGMLITAIFPILGTLLLVFAIRYFRKASSSEK